MTVVLGQSGGCGDELVSARLSAENATRSLSIAAGHGFGATATRPLHSCTCQPSACTVQPQSARRADTGVFVQPTRSNATNSAVASGFLLTNAPCHCAGRLSPCGAAVNRSV